MSVTLGPPRANRKPVLHAMDTRGRSIAYAKLGINELTCRRVRTEAANLSYLSQVTITSLITPSLIAAGQWRGLDYLLMTPLPTWPARVPALAVREKAGHAMVKAFPMLRSRLSEAAWLSRTVTDLRKCGQSDDADRLRRSADRLIERHGDVVMPLGAGHGDWSPWNMCARSEQLVVWDWERFETDVPLGWDEIHFYVGAYQHGAAAALADLRAGALIALARRSRGEAEVLLAAYLLNRGVNYLLDRQEKAGASQGPLGTWLLPALEDLLGLLGPK